MIYGNSALFDASMMQRHAAKPPQASIRQPRGTDGANVWSLIGATATLDDNSLYCNLLQTTHFASTCAIAEIGEEVAGWVSGYIPPEKPDTLFIWQVCVGEAARGLGLGRRLIGDVLMRPACRSVTALECTITHDNEASWGLFGAIARRLDAQMREIDMLDTQTHFEGRHDSEYVVRIGPFGPDAVERLTRA